MDATLIDDKMATMIGIVRKMLNTVIVMVQTGTSGLKNVVELDDWASH